MSTLSTLYISQSYQGLLHLGTNQSITSSIGQGYVQIQDGVGVWMSASIDSDGNLYLVNDVSSSTITTNDIYVDNDLIVSGNLIVHDDVELRGNVDITGSVTISENLFVSGTIHAYEVITLIESSSVIFSSGSNVIGDSTSDTQTIVGQTTISGSLGVTGTQTNTGNLFVSNAISSSTINGIGNVQLYSASVDTRLDYLEGPFSTSVDSRLDQLEIDSASQDSRLDNIENYTASLKTAFTASGTDVTFNGNINVSGSITAYKLNVLIESSSVIFSSGSNVLGDNVSDTQTLNGTVTIPNTLFVAGVEFIPFSSSVDYRLDNLEAFSSSLVFDFVTQAQLTQTASVLQTNIDKKLNSASFQSYTSSNDALVASKLNTSSFQAYTSSVDTKFNTIGTYTSSNDTKWNTIGGYTASIDTKFNTIGSYTASNDTKWNTLQNVTASLINATGSYATTGSNTFIGSNTFNGRVNGNSVSMSISSGTASLDCTLGNFFYLSIPSGSTHLSVSNIIGGQTISLKITQPSAGYGIITYNTGSIKFPQSAAPILTNNVNAEDIITFVSYTTSSLYGVITQNLV